LKGVPGEWRLYTVEGEAGRQDDVVFVVGAKLDDLALSRRRRSIGSDGMR
jgi:hypothetical protein